jgi:hypothetical protein
VPNCRGVWPQGALEIVCWWFCPTLFGTANTPPLSTRTQKLAAVLQRLVSISSSPSIGLGEAAEILCRDLRCDLVRFSCLRVCRAAAASARCVVCFALLLLPN